MTFDSSRFKYVPELDGVRAIAVAIVFLSHAGLGGFVSGGFGVTIFFFLSGYLITSLMRDEWHYTGKFSISNFYIRRSLRILPPMWIALGLTYLMVIAGLISADIDSEAVVAQVVFLSNYADLWGSVAGIPEMPLWSLAVEEHFYLLFPLFFFICLSRLKPIVAAKFCLFACMFFLALRIIEFGIGQDLEMMHLRSHLRMDSILFGCCLAFWQNPIIDRATAWRPSWKHLWMAVTVIVMTLAVRNELFRATIRYTLQGMALFVVFSFILSHQTFINSILRLSPLQLVGKYSYSIYLLHMPLLLLVRNQLPGHSSLVIGIISAVLAIAVSALIYLLCERPLANYRRTFSNAHGTKEVLAS